MIRCGYLQGIHIFHSEKFMYLRALGIAGVVVRFSVFPADWAVFVGTLARLSASSGMLYKDPSGKKRNSTSVSK